MVRITRYWCMPNSATFEMDPVRAILKKHVGDGAGWVDPFAKNSRVAEFTNDLNPDTAAAHHLDAPDFLKMFGARTVKGVLLDPPYSLHQATTTYKGYGGKRVIALTPVYDEVAKILIEGGRVITFGWNSNGLGEGRGLKMQEIYILAHGGHHNDTIITVELKIGHQITFLEESW